MIIQEAINKLIDIDVDKMSDEELLKSLKDLKAEVLMTNNLFVKGLITD